jgi:exopolysaccharide biosynthesis protein
MQCFHRRFIFISLLVLYLLTSSSAKSQPPQNPASVLLRAGEIRVNGRVRTVDTARRSFVMDVSSFTTSRGRSRMTLPPKTKIVTVARSTRLSRSTRFSQGAVSGTPLSLSSMRPGMLVAVIGDDRGEGQSLPAHVIILNAVAGERMKTLPRTVPVIRAGGFRVRVSGRLYVGTLVQVHLDTVRIKIGLGHNQVGLTESLASMAKRHGALVGINGSYFQAYNDGAHKPPVMTLITNGEAVFTGNIGTTLGFTARNEARMDRATVVLDTLRGSSSTDNYGMPDEDSSDAASAFWPRVQEAIGCGPRLVADGRIALDMRGEKFTDRKVLVLSTARSAVGLTRDRRLLLVTTSGTIPQLAGIMKALGAYQAMNLDGAASSGLWLRGRYLRSPGRDLSNSLLVLPR